MTIAPDFVLDQSYLVFVACWGTGKTLLMMTKAMELNELGEKVLILVFLNGKEIGEGQKSLLILDLEKKLKEHQNVTVKGVRYIKWEEDDTFDDNPIYPYSASHLSTIYAWRKKKFKHFQFFFSEILDLSSPNTRQKYL